MPWPNVLNMFGIGKNSAPAVGQKTPQFDTNLLEESYAPPEQQGKSQAIDWENLLKSDGQPLQMRNTEPAVDPITGKPEIFKANAPIVEAPQTPNTAGTEKSNSIWGKLKDWNTGYQKRMEDRGLINPAFEEKENPYGPSNEDKELSTQLREDIESGGNISANRLRSDSYSKKNYQENVDNITDWHKTPDGQAYSKASQDAMDAGNKAKFQGLPGGAIGEYINRMFNPNAKFKWNVNKEMKYDTPPEFR